MKLALLTSQEMGKYPKVDDRLTAALKNRGVDFEWFVWTEGAGQFADFDTALFRTIWDYWEKPDEFRQFLTVLKDSGKKTFNSIDTVLWNMDKRYLREMSDRGVQVVDSVFYDRLRIDDVEDAFIKLESSKVVLKPVFGAGAGGAFVLEKSNWRARSQEIVDYYQDSKPALIQPFLERVQTEGEFSLHYFDKKFSHGILKTPKKGDYRSQEEFGSQIVTVEPTSDQLQYASDLLEKVPDKLLYARVDFLMDDRKGPMLMELELIEPALYWEWGEGSEDVFVGHLLS